MANREGSQASSTPNYQRFTRRKETNPFETPGKHIIPLDFVLEKRVSVSDGEPLKMSDPTSIFTHRSI